VAFNILCLLAIVQLTGTQEAVKMMHIRLKILLHYLERVKNGEIERDLNILRKVKSICNMLPAIDTTQFKNDLHEVRFSLLYLQK